MKTWNAPNMPALPGVGPLPRIFDSSAGELVFPRIEGSQAGLYVCGITPYDATHLGHAFTYVAFDTLQRVWSSAGVAVQYVQNITDIDEPLLVRARETHTDWQELGSSQISLYQDDMAALSVIPPLSFVAVTEAIDLISSAVASLVDLGLAYEVPTDDASTGHNDLYFDVRGAEQLTGWHLGEVSRLGLQEMLMFSQERGGDPRRPGKRDPLDPCLWRAARTGEPSWPSVLGQGRPGWHIECSVIAVRELGERFTVQGGGHDLLFPHHELSAAHAQALTNEPLASAYVHSGLVSYQGEKMSKSRGNLVFVSELIARGHDPGAIRLALLQHHYRSHWEWFDEMLKDATTRLHRWRKLLSPQESTGKEDAPKASSQSLLDQLRACLADDLDTPNALDLFEAHLEAGVDDVHLARNSAERLFGLSL